MKTFLKFVAAFLVSMIAGSIVVTVVADRVRADESFIIAFFMIGLVGLVALIAFAAVYLAARAVRAIDWTALVVAVVYLIAMGALLGIEFYDSKGRATTSNKGMVLIAVMAASGLVVIIIQWWMVRQRFIKTRSLGA